MASVAYLLLALCVCSLLSIAVCVPGEDELIGMLHRPACLHPRYSLVDFVFIRRYRTTLAGLEASCLYSCLPTEETRCTEKVIDERNCFLDSQFLKFCYCLAYPGLNGFSVT